MKFADYIATHLNRPFRWGHNDCVTFAANWVRISTGYDHLKYIQPWRGEFGAKRVLARLGSLEQIMDHRFERINCNYALDGDLALHEDCLRLFTGSQITSPGEAGLVFFNRLEAKCAWRCA